MKYSRATWYNDLRKAAETMLTEPQAKMMRRKNSGVSRAHRLEAALVVGTPNAMQLRAVMVNMAQIARDSINPHMRAKAVEIYDECWKMLRSVDLGIVGQGTVDHESDAGPAIHDPTRWKSRKDS